MRSWLLHSHPLWWPLALSLLSAFTTVLTGKFRSMGLEMKRWRSTLVSSILYWPLDCMYWPCVSALYHPCRCVTGLTHVILIGLTLYVTVTDLCCLTSSCFCPPLQRPTEGETAPFLYCSHPRGSASVCVLAGGGPKELFIWYASVWCILACACILCRIV